jgi:hypothetical protein
MSFASFDYSTNLTYLNNNVTESTANVATHTASLAALNAISGYDTLLAPEKNSLQRSIDFNNDNITSWNNVIAEITRVLALSDADKAKLYSLYQLSEESQERWMSRMLFNTTALLEAGSPVLVDNALDNACKCMLVKVIAQQMPISHFVRFI